MPVPLPASRRRPGLRVLRQIVRRPAGAISLCLLVGLVFVAVFAPLIAPYDPYDQSLRDQFQGPSSEHWLGTDDFGRDVLSRLIYATRIVVIAPVVAVGLAVLVGLPSGLFAGYLRGRVDAVLSRIADALLSIPAIVAAIAIVAVLGPGIGTTMIAIGLVFAPRLFRIVRGATLSVVEEGYIDAAQSIGASTNRVVWVHCLPNVLAPLLVQITLMMGFALLAEAGLSFLGLGVQLPQASWGSMLKAAADQQFRAPYAVIPSGVCLTLTILAFNTLGDVVRDVTGDRKTS
ncbi:ABC transporter permease [Nocardioides sp. AE5]|uniref:ABC transporter permease n=1 Tax=Nocardioides sp. AE5 TaxID=2962573 RepID=UPI0028828DA7|nr:ABC transporter permease [Nocardioides sp. AE5]MDT0203927.1 ABC transporter permease [Nocardioides sp. AE5]